MRQSAELDRGLRPIDVGPRHPPRAHPHARGKPGREGVLSKDIEVRSGSSGVLLLFPRVGVAKLRTGDALYSFRQNRPIPADEGIASPFPDVLSP